MAEGMVEVARATVSIIPNMKGSKGIIAKETTEAMSGATGAAAAAGGKTGKGFAMGLGGALKKLLPAIGFIEVAKYLYDLGETFENVEQIIVTGTGATGDALDGLVDSAKAIATQVPSSLEDSADVVQDLNTRLGMTGDTLEDVGAKVLAVGELTGTAVDLDKLTGAFNAFGVANEEAAAKMDYMFVVSQNTGIGFNDLAGILEKNAPTLQNLGFSFEEAANMIGLLDKAGMDASGTASKMSKALVTLAKDGEEPAEAFQRVLDELSQLIEEGDTAAAIDLASGIFGTRGAAQFVGAVQSGSLSMDELKNAALGAGDGIDATMQSTMTMGQKLEVLGNKAAVVFEPLANFLMDVLSGALDAISWLADSAILTVEAFQSTFDQFGANVETVKQNVLNTVLNVVTFISGIPGQIAGFFSGIAGQLGAYFEAARASVTFAFTAIVGFVSSIPGRIVGFFSGIGGRLLSPFTTVVSGIRSAFNSVVNFIRGIVSKIQGLFNFRFSLPHIPVPNFAIRPSGWQLGDLLKGVIPSLDFSWKARGGIATGATIYGIGEAGNEAIVPLSNPYMAPFAQAVAEEMGGGAGVYNVYLNDVAVNDSEAVRDITADYLIGLKRLAAI